MDPRRVLTFRAVAHERSFSRAGEALALTQPAVSQQVAALERELGAQLLDARPGGLTLTRAGELAARACRRVADRLELADTQLAELAGGERARLRIGAFPSALATLVPAARRAAARATARRRGAGRGGRQRGAGRARRAPASCTSRVGFQDAALPRREHEGLERHDLLREPFLVALAPATRSPAARRSRSPSSPSETWIGAVARRPDRPRVPRGRLRAADRLVTRDPLAIRGLVAARPRGHARPAAARATGSTASRCAPIDGDGAAARRLRAAPARRPPPARRATRAARSRK